MIESINIMKFGYARMYNGRFNANRLNRIIFPTKPINNNIYWEVCLIDVFRQLLMADYGGIYVDTDTFPIKPFDDYILECPFNCCTNYNIDGFFMGNCKQDK